MQKFRQVRLLFNVFIPNQRRQSGAPKTATGPEAPSPPPFVWGPLCSDWRLFER